MNYFLLEPEVAGEIGENTVMDTSIHPPRVERLHYEIGFGWHGDELLETFPCYIVSNRIAANLIQSDLRAFELRDVELTLTEEAQEGRLGVEVPKFRWLAVTGIAGRDDLGVTNEAQLVVSERALDVMRSGPIDNCLVEPFPAV